jgi:retinol-binding protein 3
VTARAIRLSFLLGTLMLAMAVAAQQVPPDFEIAAAERDAAIEGALARLNEAYVFEEVAAEMERAIRERVARGEYDAITSASELAHKLTDDLRAVSGDKHLRILYFEDGVPQQADGAPTPAALAQRRESLRRINLGFEKVERLQGNVGYIDLRFFIEPSIAADTATAAMTFVANADALIVDLRRNGGGSPAMIAYTLSYLFDGATHLNDIYDRVADSTSQFWTSPNVPGLRFGESKPVFVLTSGDTFSGGEEFAYNLKHLERATLIGETTGGGAHPVRTMSASERFAIGVPSARAINPVTGTNWEGTGVTPHIRTPAEDALGTAHRLALESILERSDDPAHRTQLQRLLDGGDGGV